jgi:hypothetical protein
MYTDHNFKTKKQLKEALKEGRSLTVYQPNADLTGATVPLDGEVVLEGPHYPAMHTWYAVATLENGLIVKVK